MCLAVPGRLDTILDETPEFRRGTVNFGGLLKEVNLTFVPEVEIGDYVLVHVGFALSAIDEAEAARVLGYLREIEELSELEEGER